MDQTDIIVVGAGICGLTIANGLSRKGKKVLVVEARDRIGGRIHTITDSGGESIERGAEFIHGKAETTRSLIKRYKLETYKAGGEFVRIRNGKIVGDDQVGNWKLLSTKLKELSTDISVDEFLNRFFDDGKCLDFKENIRKYVEGFDSADPARASAFAFRDELSGHDESDSRIRGGYSILVDAIADDIEAQGGKIHLSAVVRSIHWHEGWVEIQTADKTNYQAKQVIITVPLGVLINEDGESGITFHPSLPDYKVALRSMGFGNVIKVVIKFNDNFWQHPHVRKRFGKSIEKMGFIFSDAAIPTWWTQYPQRSNLLTGWLGHPASAYRHSNNATIRQMAVDSLSYIFQMTTAEIGVEIHTMHIVNWTKDPFTLGAYAYKTVKTDEAAKILSEPVKETIFFAGEALYMGKEMGTVEAALKNALEVVDKMNV